MAKTEYTFVAVRALCPDRYQLHRASTTKRAGNGYI
nr:MAG TPA: hypothetical protein [Caudoviricetes sp.]